jgi:hypothetical protein
MQRKVLEHLAESGNVSYSCKKAGISRETYYAWKKDDKMFAHDAELSMEYGKSSVNDLAHSQLIRNIQDGNMQAVRFQLVSCHEDYQPRRARAPKEERPIPITTIHITPAPGRKLDKDFVPISRIQIFPAPSPERRAT